MEADAHYAGRRVGRYVLYDPIASGGMATVHFGRMLGPVGFTRTVAIKRLHPHLARDPEFVTMFLDEARLAARVQHPNVIATLDIVATGGEVFLVMDYVKGEALSGLVANARRNDARLPMGIVASVLCGALHGLHAAHQATSDRGDPLEIVHRDVSPHNILVGEDGVARLADFGVARAAWRMQSTQGDKLKGKIAYMAPEQLEKRPLDHRVDVYAAGVVLWECLAGRRLFHADNPASVVHDIMTADVAPPSRFTKDVCPDLDALALRALARRPGDRFRTALEMATELERVLAPASQSVVGEWVRATAASVLAQRAARLAVIEATPPGAVLPAAGQPAPLLLDSTDAVRRLSSAPTQPEILLDGAPAASANVADLSSISLSGEIASPARSRRPAWLASAGAVIAATAALVLVLRPHTTSVGPPSQPGPTVGAPALVLPPADDQPSAASPPMPLPAPAPSAPSVPVPASTALPVVHPGPARVVRHAGRPPPPGNCDPPYTLDPSSVSPDGQPLKRFKPWCI